MQSHRSDSAGTALSAPKTELDNTEPKSVPKLKGWFMQKTCVCVPGLGLGLCPIGTSSSCRTGAVVQGRSRHSCFSSVPRVDSRDTGADHHSVPCAGALRGPRDLFSPSQFSPSALC